MSDLLVVAGFGVGALVGLTGVGGGALMTPILVLLFGYSPKVAIGTDLLFAALTKLCGVAMHRHAGTIDVVVLKRLLSGSVPAALLTGLAMYVWGSHIGQTLERFMLLSLGCLLLVSALGVFFRDALHALGRSLRLGDAERFKRWQGPLTVTAGSLIGVAVSLTSVGAGALGAVALLYLYPLRLQGARLVATDLAHAIPLALVAGVAHWLVGGVDWELLGMLLLGSIPGVLLGVWMSRWLAVRWVNYAVAGLLSVSGLKLLLN
ncbi:MAG TPA: hypothetical protein DCQ80_09510 [Pseudomonas sp.]|nr:hypothetical protein [Pseudomonas sp.]